MFRDLFSFSCGQNFRVNKYTYLSTFNSVISMALSQGPLPYLARHLAVYNRLIQYLTEFHNIVLAFSEKLVVKQPNFEIRLFIIYFREIDMNISIPKSLLFKLEQNLSAEINCISKYEVIEFYFAIRIGHGLTRWK